MGIWNKLFGNRRPPSPDDIRRDLFDAIARQDETKLAKLAAEHEAIVLEHFPTWQRLPEHLRGDPEATQHWGQGLVGVAMHFANERGRPELMMRLMGPSADNPITRWQEALSDADTLMESGKYDDALARLTQTLDEAQKLTGSAVDSLVPIALGRIGSCHFQVGRVEEAMAPLERALALCEEHRDADGVHAYLGNLYELHRYRGDGEAAATCLMRRADVTESLGDREAAARDRRQAAIVRAGEPLCRIVASVGDALVEIDDLPPNVDHVRFVFARNRIALRPSTAAVEAGVARGEAGDFEGALACFERAAAEDRFNPWPSYHAGMTLLHLRRYGDAVRSFRETEELAPGFYHCRADRWLAEQLAAGAVDHAVFERVRDLVDGAHSPEHVVREAEKALAKKNLGVLHLVAGNALSKLGRDGEAEAAYRRGLAIAEEPDVETRLLVGLAGRLPAHEEERHRLLQRAVELRGNLVTAAMATVMLRQAADA